MYISKMILTNFKSFSGVHELNFNKGINYFVGDNNAGKTTIFKAIEFIQSGKQKDAWITLGEESNDVSVELVFAGDDILELVNQQPLLKYKNYVFEKDDTYNLKILRDSKAHTWTNDKKQEKTTAQNNVLVWHPEKEEWQNPTGIDSTITALFDAQFVYSDIKNEDYQDFSKTKVVGKIMSTLTNDFEKMDVYTELRDAHTKAFGEDGLKKPLEKVQNNIEEILTEQYGDTNVKFEFTLPSLDNLLKGGQVLLKENNIETDAGEKGTGMQRALALALIQVYADMEKSTDIDKPLLFFIDEPETFLHPKAQEKLIKSFQTISDESQVFITTHSPYLLKLMNKTESVFVFSRKGDRISNETMLCLFPFSPTWGEINYFAFDVVSVELHNELFGHLQKVSGQGRENEFDTWLVQNGLEKNITYSREGSGGIITQQKTLPMFVRNIIHHPENTNNEYSKDQLRESIDMMINIVTSMNSNV